MNKILATKLGKIEYSIKGKGEAILFIHGGHSNSSETTFHAGYDLEKYKLITPSRPGYGHTPLNGHMQPSSAAKLIGLLIDYLKLSHVIIVGISAGGLTAIELASQFNDKVKKLILISAISQKWLRPNDELYIRGKKMFSPEREKMSWLLYRFFFRLFPKQMSKVLFNEVSSKKSHLITKNEIQEIRKMTFVQRSGEGFSVDLDQNISEDTFPNVVCPTLILHSVNDKSVNIEMAKTAHRKIMNSKLKTFDNAWGHLLWVGEDKKEAIAVVEDFLEN